MNLLKELRSSWSRDKLKGKRVHFRARWDAAERAGKITRISANTVWIGAFCFHHDDLVSLSEAC